MPLLHPAFDQDDCFAAGTKIATARGPVRVEAVHPGDRVCTLLGGDTAKVVWTGHRVVDCARHPNPEKVWPVRVAAHAFGRGMPAEDLVLSPGHAVYVDGVLIPVRLLANGRSVRQFLTGRIAYHHIQLSRHDVLLANGMPAESFLESGDRTLFGNGGEVVALHPDFAARPWGSATCAPVMRAGPELEGVIRRLTGPPPRRSRRPRATLAPVRG